MMDDLLFLFVFLLVCAISAYGLWSHHIHEKRLEEKGYAFAKGYRLVKTTEGWLLIKEEEDNRQTD